MATTTSNTDFNAFVNSTIQLSIALTPILISLYLAVSFVKYVRRWWGANLVPESHQREARRLQTEFDSVSELPRDTLEAVLNGEGEVIRRKPRKGNAGWWMAYAVMARGKFHDPSNTVAMRRSIHKWIYEQMEADRVTKLDIARVVHRAVEWTYHADVGEVKAGMDRNSRAMVEREIDYTAPWWSYWWGVSRRTAGNG